jgi:hypothetical protein
MAANTNSDIVGFILGILSALADHRPTRAFLRESQT